MYSVRPHTGPQVVARRTLGDSSRTAGLTRTPVLKRLVEGPTDVMDLCINALNGAERAHLARSFQLGTRGAAAIDRPNTQAFIERLAVSNRRAFLDAIQPGPLRSILVSTISKQGSIDALNDLWITINSRSHAQLVESQQSRLETQQEAQALGLPRDTARDVAMAIYALDCLVDAAPHTQTWLVIEGGDAEGSSSHKNRRAAGQKALLAAAQFSGSMQRSLLGHVATGCALAFAGHKEAAVEVFDLLLTRDLKNDLRAGLGDLGLHLSHLMLSPDYFVDRCLLWIKTAALVCDSPRINAVYLQALDCVPQIDNRWPEASTLNERWPVLGGETYLGSQADIAWLRAMGFTELLSSSNF